MKKSIVLPEPVLWLFQRLEQAGYQVYAVGGCVRDALLGKAPQDWDLCTDARPEEMLRLFSDCQTIDAGKKHGTITVILEHQPYEITTFRTEGVYKDGRHPENVQFISDLKEDLCRRDFTMNAMAYHPGEGIVDLYGGISDLKQGMLRCVGDPEKRFSEDALRILRGLRFAACYRYQLEPTAAQAAVKLAPSLRQISAERIAAEFDRFLKGDGKTVAALLRDFTPVWDVILPECRKLRACAQHHPRHCNTVWEHTLRVVEAVSASGDLRWAALLHDIAKPDTKTTDAQGTDHFYRHEAAGAVQAECILKRFHLEKKRITEICTLIRCHGLSVPAEPRSMRRMLCRYGEDITRQYLLLRKADCAGQAPEVLPEELPKIQNAKALLEQILRENACFQLKDLAVNGNDLLKIGIKKGPRLGVILKNLLELVVDEAVPNERKALLQQAKALSITLPSLPAVPIPDNNDSDTCDKIPENPCHLS